MSARSFCRLLPRPVWILDRPDLAPHHIFQRGDRQFETKDSPARGSVYERPVSGVLLELNPQIRSSRHNVVGMLELRDLERLAEHRPGTFEICARYGQIEIEADYGLCVSVHGLSPDHAIPDLGLVEETDE